MKLLQLSWYRRVKVEAFSCLVPIWFSGAKGDEDFELTVFQRQSRSVAPRARTDRQAQVQSKSPHIPVPMDQIRVNRLEYIFKQFQLGSKPFSTSVANWYLANIDMHDQGTHLLLQCTIKCWIED